VSGALAERPLRLFEEARRRAPVALPWRPESFDGGRLTLERRLESVWEGLAATDEAECPVCRGRMTRPAGAPAAEPARCDDCGSTLA
jgi:DNA-directed RNA polymerase subunit RPC12/RpoP